MGTFAYADSILRPPLDEPTTALPLPELPPEGTTVRLLELLLLEGTTHTGTGEEPEEMETIGDWHVP